MSLTFIRSFFALLASPHTIKHRDVNAEQPDATLLNDPALYAHYQQHVAPLAVHFEEKRVKTLLTIRKNTLVSLPIFLLGMLLALTLPSFVTITEDEHTAYGTLGVLLLGLILGVWIGTPIFQYQDNARDLLFQKIMPFFGDDFRYQRRKQGGFLDSPIKPFIASGIIPIHDHCSLEDIITGTHNGVQLHFFEARLSERIQQEKRVYLKQIFQGFFVSLTLQKPFQGKTILLKDSGTIGNWLRDKLQSLQPVRLEDPIFEKHFEAYTSDQIEARYLLTTSFMERLLHLIKHFHTSKMQASFYDKQLLLMVETQQNRFELPSIHEPINFARSVAELYTEIHKILAIIDLLKLAEKTGL